MKRRNLLSGLLTGPALLMADRASAQTIDYWGLLHGRPLGSERLKLEITKLLLNIKLALMLHNKQEAKRLALLLPVLSQRDPDWYKYPESFQIAMILVSLTDPNDRKAWVFANEGLLECFPGIFGGNHNESCRAVAKAGCDLLVADAAGPPLVTGRVRVQAAALALVTVAFAPGRERVRWAQVARQELLKNPEAAALLRDWSVDAITPRFVAAGIAVSGDWKAASRDYQTVLAGSIGNMDSLIRERKNSTIGGLGALVAGATTVEAEGATVFAMSGQVDRALELLERSRRNTGRVRRDGLEKDAKTPTTAIQLEERLLATGATIVQPITSLVGAFAMVSTRRKGKTLRFMAFNPEPGGYDLMSRMVDSRSDHFVRDGLAPVYQRARRSRGKAAEAKFRAYVARAAVDAEALTGSTIRSALVKAAVTAQDEVVVILPGNLGLLPISLSRNTPESPPLGRQYRLRYADSLASALSAAERAKVPREEQTLGLLLPDPAVADLEYLGFERACVASCFPERTRKVESAADTSSTLLSGLDGATHWHIASHASWDFKDPDRSGIAVGRKRTVTIAEVMSMSLAKPPRLAFLSACETGLINIDKGLDEFSGLLSAFLACGAGGAIGSQWPVSDAATSLLTARFYDEHIGNRKRPAEALQTAQRWLSEAPAAALSTFVRDKVQATKITIEEAASIESFLIEKRADERVFDDPYYWAGFQLYGA